MDEYNIWIVNEMDMTPIQVHYPWGKFQAQTQSGTPSTTVLSVHDETVGMRDLDVMLRWSHWQSSYPE